MTTMTTTGWRIVGGFYFTAARCCRVRLADCVFLSLFCSLFLSGPDRGRSFFVHRRDARAPHRVWLGKKGIRGVASAIYIKKEQTRTRRSHTHTHMHDSYVRTYVQGGLRIQKALLYGRIRARILSNIMRV